MGIKYRVDAKPVVKPKTAGERLIKAATEASEMAKRGRPKTGTAKQLLTLRLDPDVIAGYRATGDGWQVLMNTVLRRYLHL